MDRLIDADHLKAAFLNSSHVWMSYEQAAQTVDREPTADARSVIHAHWIMQHDRTWACSACQSLVEEESTFDYCPYCGARMDEEPENAFD